MDNLANRLSPIAAHLARRAHLVALALFAVVGVAVLEDYGIANDEGVQRGIGSASFNYALGDESALPEDVNRFYGVAFEAPLIAVERVFQLETSRAVDLSRRLITHAFFLLGGFFAWLLAYRLFGSRVIALFAMLIFLSHPRMYAHSFFNTKDLPFLSMFMVALYLTHRAFRQDSVWAFALCGAGAALLANMRITGVMLVPAVLGMLALDAALAARRWGLWQGAKSAPQPSRRRRRYRHRRRQEGAAGMKSALANAGAFAASFAIVLYAAWPLLWRGPTEFADAFQVMSRHTTLVDTLFRGELVRHPNVPWDFAPTWALITTPPVALILAALGIAAVVRLCAADWRGMFANSTARFGLLTLACLILPVAAVIALNSNLYNDWRQMYFLYAPMCVLAAFGLNLIAEKIPKPRLRAAAFALAALGIALVAVQVVRLHPYQQEYFNPLAAKSGLADRWQMNYWRIFHKEALDELLKIQPSGRIAVMSPGYYQHLMARNFDLFPEDERGRFLISPKFPSFRVVRGDGGDAPVLWKREIYGVPIVSIVDARAESEDLIRETYAAARESAPSASGGGFDVYADGDSLAYIKEDCAESDTRGRFKLSVFPIDQSDLPQSAQAAGRGLEALNFNFAEHGAALDGGCVIIRDLPDYPISHVEIGQWIPGASALWNARIEIGE